MMKQSIEWHKQCLINNKRYLDEKRQEKERAQDRYFESLREVEFYTEQIEAAKKKKKDGFDRDRFLIKKAP